MIFDDKAHQQQEASAAWCCTSRYSAEHGSQNWTPDFLAQFRRRRGHDLLRHLPAMVGIPVGSGDADIYFVANYRAQPVVAHPVSRDGGPVTLRRGARNQKS